ncbi:hypothetical protein [Streptomyces sp. MH13]|uniref:hypothetical protein n=1 Tax=Streptomyces sp. MH13 TaxID=3417651 RepID=UPI003CEF7BB0
MPLFVRVVRPTGRRPHPVTRLLERDGSSAALRKAGRRKLVETAGPRAPALST